MCRWFFCVAGFAMYALLKIFYVQEFMNDRVHVTFDILIFCVEMEVMIRITDSFHLFDVTMDLSFLKGESLLPEQKQAICGFLEAPEHERWTVKQVSNYLKLSDWRIYKIIKAKSTGRTFQIGPGNVQRIDDTGIENLKRLVMSENIENHLYQ
jgi:hypothetical protein